MEEEALRSFLGRTLTEYMVPQVYVRLDAMPLNANGKIDRKALPEPTFARTSTYVAPETEIEWAVAECMQKVLGVSQPIGALDSFFELGGDSIKAIRIITELRNRNVTVSVADIMKEKTVRSIAAVARRQEQAEISQAPITGEIEDTPIIRFFKELKLPMPSHFNQSMLLQCRDRAVPALVQQAIDALTVQHDLLRAAWVNEHLLVRDIQKRIVLEEYSADTDAVTNICNEIQSGIRMEEALIRIALIHGDGRDYLLMAAHHLIVDGVSWRILVEDIETVYGQLLRGEDVKLPQKTHTYADYAAAVRTYRTGYRLSLEKDYWDEVQRQLLSMPTTDALDYSRPMKQKRLLLEADVTDQILHMDLSEHLLEINDVLLTAVCASYAAITGEERMSIQMEGHGREDIGAQLMIDRTVGWFTSIYPVIVDGIKLISADTAEAATRLDILTQNLMKVKETLHRVPNKGVGYNILRAIPGEDGVDYAFDRMAEIGFNYLGEMSMDESANGGSDGQFFRGATVSSGNNLAAENIFGPDLSINCSAANGRFMWMLDYNSSKYTDERADMFLQEIAKMLKDMVKLLQGDSVANEVTASDLGEMEWSQEEFRAVMEDYASRGERVYRIYPLTPMQEGMLLKHLEDPNDWAYRIVNYFEIDMVPTKEQLTYAMNKMMENNEVLRTAIIHEGVSIPRQALVDRSAYVEMLDIRDAADPEKAVEKIREDILTHGFDLQRKPLAQLYCAVASEDSCYLIVAVHHAIIDGWSFQIFIDQLFDYLEESLS